MPVPNFICIGVQKAGTSSLINYLNQHPDIFMALDELHFFDKPKNYILENNDFSRYESNFNTDKQIIGEKTPSYNYLQFAIDRIHKYNSNMKLILILREPISRAFSEYNMYLKFNNKKLSDVSEKEILKIFKEEEKHNLDELENNGAYFIVRGFYDEIIEYILKKFKKENLFIGISEEIIQNKLSQYLDQIFIITHDSQLAEVGNIIKIE